MTMRWQDLLSDKRLGKSSALKEHDRTAFQKDVDRIIFSSAFRRLQDKTQVFPLAQNDYVRTRLTHSLEVSSVGRSLGTLVGKHITTAYHLTHITPEDFGSIVAAAFLSPDIGNPPFGHFGEAAIRAFFFERAIGRKIQERVTETEWSDLQNFEGNAQGFRIVTQLQSPDVIGGMQLTHATLGTFVKYPCTQRHRNHNVIANKKNGLLLGDIPLFEEVADNLGLIRYADEAWARHPLVYLMEAADDICYAIIDIEDAYQIRQIDYETAIGLLKPLTASIDHLTFSKMQSHSDQISYLRAKAIGNLIQQTVRVFLDEQPAILAGEYHCAVADKIESAEPLAALTKYAAQHIYSCSAVVETEIAGYRILGDLLEMFCEAAEDVAASQQATRAASESLPSTHSRQQNPKQKPKPVSEMLIHLLPTRFIGENRQFSPSCYIRTLKIIDYISGMTDSYAVGLFQRLTGVKL